MKTIDLYDQDLAKEIYALPFTDKISDDNMIFIPESDYGFAQIYRMFDDILCFTIPTYGGTPSFYKCVGRHAIPYLISELKK